MKIGQTVRHANPDCYLGDIEGEVIWIDPSGTFCDVLFNLPTVEDIPHPFTGGRYLNRFNDPRRLPVRLLKLAEKSDASF